MVVDRIELEGCEVLRILRGSSGGDEVNVVTTLLSLHELRLSCDRHRGCHVVVVCPFTDKAAISRYVSDYLVLAGRETVQQFVSLYNI